MIWHKTAILKPMPSGRGKGRCKLNVNAWCMCDLNQVLIWNSVNLQIINLIFTNRGPFLTFFNSVLFPSLKCSEDLVLLLPWKIKHVIDKQLRLTRIRNDSPTLWPWQINFNLISEKNYQDTDLLTDGPEFWRFFRRFAFIDIMEACQVVFSKCVNLTGSHAGTRRWPMKRSAVTNTEIIKSRNKYT